MPIKERLEYALYIAFEAERIILSSFQDPKLKIEVKKDASVVTVADRESERRMRELITRLYPEDGIIGEELGVKDGTSGYVWILDPIDGTQEFVCGVPLFGTLVGLTYQGKPVAGVAHLPAIKETYYASVGEGSWWRPAAATTPIRAKVSEVATLSESMFTTTSMAGFERAHCGELFEKLRKATRKFRGWGSCYGHLLVASGRTELMVEASLKIWDCAALAPIVTEAGGRFFDLSGRERIDGGSGVSCNARIAEELKRLLGSSVAGS